MNFHVCASIIKAVGATVFDDPLPVSLGREIYRSKVNHEVSVMVQFRPDFNWFTLRGKEVFKAKVNRDISEFYKGRVDDFDKTEIRGRLYLFDIGGSIYVMWKRASQSFFYGFSVIKIEVSTCGCKKLKDPLMEWDIKEGCLEMDQKFINWLNS
jgi:hypothetical protein